MKFIFRQISFFTKPFLLAESLSVSFQFTNVRVCGCMCVFVWEARGGLNELVEFSSKALQHYDFDRFSLRFHSVG